MYNHSRDRGLYTSAAVSASPLTAQSTPLLRTTAPLPSVCIRVHLWFRIPIFALGLAPWPQRFGRLSPRRRVPTSPLSALPAPPSLAPHPSPLTPYGTAVPLWDPAMDPGASQCYLLVVMPDAQSQNRPTGGPDDGLVECLECGAPSGSLSNECARCGSPLVSLEDDDGGDQESADEDDPPDEVPPDGESLDAEPPDEDKPAETEQTLRIAPPPKGRGLALLGLWFIANG
jgi:hypothetical protein